MSSTNKLVCTAEVVLPFKSLGSELVTSQDIFWAARGRVLASLEEQQSLFKPTDHVDWIEVTEIFRTMKAVDDDCKDMQLLVRVAIKAQVDATAVGPDFKITSRHT